MLRCECRSEHREAGPASGENTRPWLRGTLWPDVTNGLNVFRPFHDLLHSYLVTISSEVAFLWETQEITVGSVCATGLYPRLPWRSFGSRNQPGLGMDGAALGQKSNLPPTAIKYLCRKILRRTDHLCGLLVQLRVSGWETA